MSTTTKLRNNNGLTNEQIFKVAPSVFATEEHQECSDKYIFIPTVNIMEGLRKEGFIPVEVMQGGTRKEGKKEFTKHMIRYRHVNDLGNNTLNSDVTEIVNINSHDRSSSYQLMSGIFRLVCTNGLVTGKIDNDYRIKHQGNIIDDVIESTCRIVEDSKETINIINEMKKINLNREEQLLLSEISMSAKYSNDEEEEDQESQIKNNKKDLPWTPELFLKPRRLDDNKTDLYTTYNVIQENLIKGGQRVYTNRYERRSTRGVNSIDGNVKINKMLWQLANKMLELKV